MTTETHPIPTWTPAQEAALREAIQLAEPAARRARSIFARYRDPPQPTEAEEPTGEPTGDAPVHMKAPIHHVPRPGAYVGKSLKTPGFRDDVVRLRKAGKSRGEIATTLGCSVALVGNALRLAVEAGQVERMIARPKRTGRPKGTFHKAPITGHQIIVRCSLGESIEDIARSFDVHPSLICERRRRYLAEQASTEARAC